MSETLKQPLAPGLETVDSTASGEIGYNAALREVLELIKGNTVTGTTFGSMGETLAVEIDVCHSEELKAKIQARLGDEPFQSGGV